MNKAVYIHYGHKEFDPKLFVPVSNIPYRNKPIGGLWASPVDAEFGWKDWCEAEEFKECKEENSFRFCLKDGSKVYHIRNKLDVGNLPKQNLVKFPRLALNSVDFEKMRSQGWQAVELHLSGSDTLYFDLYGWDCDCILVLDLSIVEEMSNDRH